MIRRHRVRHRSQAGLGAVAVIVVLVAMAGIAAAVLRLGAQGATTGQQDVQAMRAGAAVRSGVEWGLYQALKGSWTACAGASQTLDLRSESGMYVTVSCSASSYNEGESAPGTPAVVRIYTIDAIACNGSSGSSTVSSVKEVFVVITWALKM